MTNTRLHRAVSPFDQSLLRILLLGPRSGLDLVRLCTMGQPDPWVVRATYLALHRLERRGLLAGEWRQTSDRRFSIKHYRVTASGCRSATGSHAGGVPRSQLTVLIVISLIWAADSLKASHDSDRQRLTIVLDDGADIPSADIARARRHVRAFLVPSVWR
jgi:hypothetical protein